MKEVNCRARLEGIVEDELYFSHSVFGERFYEGKYPYKGIVEYLIPFQLLYLNGLLIISKISKVE